MRLLLDTQALLWFGLDDPRMSDLARSLIDNISNQIEISPASYWEIAIKVQLGKYKSSESFGSFFESIVTSYCLTVLPIEIRHAAVLTTLPMHHRDPFDRLLIAQAISEGVPIVSSDAEFDSYPITRLW